jgi:hypothetical protein
MSELIGFAKGLSVMSTKGIIGVKVNLTKKRANALRDLMSEAVYNVPDCEHTGTARDDCHCRDDYRAAIEWVLQQVQKRYSMFDLCDE